MYKNWKVERLFELLVENDLGMTERDFADLALAAADQAGMPMLDQSLFETRLTQMLRDRQERARKSQQSRRGVQ